jgi:hypothetical protein
MNGDTVADRHRRMAEQISSDERILGVLPEDAASVLLDWSLARLGDAAAAAGDDAAWFEQEAEAIREQTRAEADAAAERGDDGAALAAYLGVTGEATRADALTEPADATEPEPLALPAHPEWDEATATSEAAAPEQAAPDEGPPSSDDAAHGGPPWSEPDGSVGMFDRLRRWWRGDGEGR